MCSSFTTTAFGATGGADAAGDSLEPPNQDFLDSLGRAGAAAAREFLWDVFPPEAAPLTLNADKAKKAKVAMIATRISTAIVMPEKRGKKSIKYRKREKKFFRTIFCGIT